MRHWALWIVIAVICGVIEMLTPQFFIAWFGVGALCAALLASLGAGGSWQVSAFIVVSLVLVLSTKRLSAKWFRAEREQKTNVDALLGQEGLVTTPIPQNGTGQVKTRNEIWTAVSADNCPIPAGVTVKVVRVEGVHLVVSASDTGY